MDWERIKIYFPTFYVNQLVNSQYVKWGPSFGWGSMNKIQPLYPQSVIKLTTFEHKMLM